MCVGPSLYQGQSNISWDPLPCHLQNGADIIDNDYIIQYTLLPTGEPTNISSSNNRLECHQDSGGHYSCVAHSSLFTFGVAYSFQVAVRNIYGVGSFSNPVTAVYGSQGSCFCTWHDNNNCYGFCSGHKHVDTNCTLSVLNLDQGKDINRHQILYNINLVATF